MIYSPWELFNSIHAYARIWLHDWGDLALTGVIAWAAIMQWVVSSRLFGLTKAVENFKNRPLLFCRISGDDPLEGLPSSWIDTQLSNLSSFGIWIEEAVLVLDGKVLCESTRSFPIGAVLQAGATRTVRLFEAPFGEIVAIGGPKVTVKIQVKFYYSTAHTIGVQASPVYLMTVDQTVVTKLIVEKNIPERGPN
jgi:hypothetical protein